MRDIIHQYKKQLKDASPVDCLAFFQSEYRNEIAFSTSLGAEDQVITDMIAKMDGSIRLFTLDTGRLFQETYDLIDITQKRYKLKIRVCFPDAGEVEKMVAEKGINLFYESVENRKECCAIRKIEPLKRALSGMRVWVSGLLRDQSVTRDTSEMIEWDENYGIIKVNPLIDWDQAQVWDYIRKHHVPYNELHDKGFPSIGCLPCTRAVLPGEDVRAGRWWWELPEFKECGIHKKT